MKTINQELHDHLSFLTTIQPARNWINRSSLTLAADYISDTFKLDKRAIYNNEKQIVP